ncbi:THUMP-like domain-containing protein [Xylanibacter muris]|uniref:SAM-dependent methyltransferase n=1 Tax=Xylanibacter muris TaxID=2736290 RepID=A0ABX2AJV5_9BACT|nr:SAM-dependent methyltransferase [Xylanibacter muris]NPD90782.1 SAM-dependent methyltransferase [Xylanibacter muris]
MALLNEQTRNFISKHSGDDVRQLALKYVGAEGVDMKQALCQISGLQTARRKLPSWGNTEGIVYPPGISMEQCSGEQSARYKATVAARLVTGKTSSCAGNIVFADITGGFGVDFSFIAGALGGGNGDGCVYVERQEVLCKIAKNNFPLLGLYNAEIICGDGLEFIRNADNVSLVYLDPARRDGNGARTYDIKDCTPDAIGLMPLLLDKADMVMIKLSPMLDWRKAVCDLGNNVTEVHIVSAGNECKELLFVIMRGVSEPLHVFCVNDGCVVDYYADCLGTSQEWGACRGEVLMENMEGMWLYEPNASVMKAGCFGIIESRYGVRQIAVNSHLFVGESLVADFPGRSFRIRAVATMNRKELKEVLKDIVKANITVRNFPLSVAALRKRLRIADGGDDYIFATTLSDGSHILIIGNRFFK